MLEFEAIEQMEVMEVNLSKQIIAKLVRREMETFIESFIFNDLMSASAN